MERLFSTHSIRSSRECSPIWTLATLDEGGLLQPEKVIVPSVWESHPALRNYRGRALYEQTIHASGNLRIALGGVSFRAKVYLDGILLADHYGAYTGFDAFALNLAEGEHRLQVEVDNRFTRDSALHLPNDYYCYGGINRPVLLEELQDAYISRFHVLPKKMENGWSADAEIAVRNLTSHPLHGSLCFSVAGHESCIPIDLPENDTSTFSFSIPCPDAEPWSPDSPVLYTTQALLTLDRKPADDLIDRIGFREIRTEGRQILLNGRVLHLKGFNRHEEYGVFGLSAPVEAMIHDVQLLHDLGANCIRTCHYPNDPRFLDLCDETGLLVWEESHARGLSEEQMRHPQFMNQLRLSTTEMVNQHFNHPSIFVWGCLNECADNTEYGADCYREIFMLLHSLDNSRPVTSALLERPGGRVYGDMDIVSINIYPQWYQDVPVSESLQKKLKEIDACGGKGKPVIVSEIGAGAIYGYHDPFGEAKWSEERQCRILESQITSILSSPDVSGVFLWQFADVRVDEEWSMRRPRTYNNKGVTDEHRRPKASYMLVKKLFREFQ